MDKSAITKAETRLQVARETLEALMHCRDHKSFSGKWYVFLVTTKNVYTALEQGAKANAQSRQWFGGKKQERKDDELLQYLLQARDDDEHGLGAVTEHVGDNIKLGPGGDGYSMNVRVTRFADHMLLEGLDGLPVNYEHEPAHFRLTPVTGRGPVIYQPPTTHKQKPVGDNSPLGVGALVIVHLEALIEEARSRT